MIWLILWVLIGWALAGCALYLEVQKGNGFCLTELLIGIWFSAFLGPLCAYFPIKDYYGKQILEFFNKPVIGGKK